VGARYGGRYVGERVQTRHGPAAVERIAVWPGRHRVRNLEIAGTHQYLVTEHGVRTHNACLAMKFRNALGSAVKATWRGVTRMFAPNTAKLVWVSRWGSAIEPGRWVVIGMPSIWKYFWSFKWLPFNQPAWFSSAVSRLVERQHLTTPGR